MNSDATTAATAATANVVLQSTQTLRTHWWSAIINLLGYMMAANILLWAYFLNIYFTKTNSDALVIPILLSSFLLAVWRLYVRYIDDRIAGLYSTLLYCEYSLALPVEYGTSNYLKNEIPPLNELLVETVPWKKRIEAISFLVKIKRIGYRGHQFFEAFVGLVFAVYYIILYQLNPNLSALNDLFKFCWIFLIISTGIWIFENIFYQKSPGPENIIAAKQAAHIEG